MPFASETMMLTKLSASPLRSNIVNVPHPDGITAPVNEKPRTVLEEFETVNPAASASPPDAPLSVAPSTVN